MSNLLIFFAFIDISQLRVILPNEKLHAFSLLVFRYATWCFRVQSVMYLIYTPSFTCRASCLTKNFRR